MEPAQGILVFGGMLVGMVVLLVLLSILGFAFWLWMLIDCLKRDFKDKVVWVVMLLLTSILGALLYFFLVKRKLR